MSHATRADDPIAALARVDARVETIALCALAVLCLVLPLAGWTLSQESMHGSNTLQNVLYWILPGGALFAMGRFFAWDVLCVLVAISLDPRATSRAIGLLNPAFSDEMCVTLLEHQANANTAFIPTLTGPVRSHLFPPNTHLSHHMTSCLYTTGKPGRSNNRPEVLTASVETHRICPTPLQNARLVLAHSPRGGSWRLKLNEMHILFIEKATLTAHEHLALFAAIERRRQTPKNTSIA